ncbi:hypothetical protein CspHIS471_0405680 [Cutaneotrichosporon sp. HIS471]|nr:hypothetical protein CspHIS471_0405680 [Cutaneotrichosporon sp. HIS471]
MHGEQPHDLQNLQAPPHDQENREAPHDQQNQEAPPHYPHQEATPHYQQSWPAPQPGILLPPPFGPHINTLMVQHVENLARHDPEAARTIAQANGIVLR